MDFNLKERIAVVIPCYKSKLQIMGVLSGIGAEVWRVYVIDDACPEGFVNTSGKCPSIGELCCKEQIR